MTETVMPQRAVERECTLCGQTKPTSEFYSGRVDCKECKRAMSRDYYSREGGARVALVRAYRARLEDEARRQKRR